MEESVKLRLGKDSSLNTIASDISADFYLKREFNVGSVASKILILQLAARQPRSFKSGSKINLNKVLSEPNRTEYHHCFPKSYAKKNQIDLEGISVGCLANYAFLNRAENREISDKAPSEYRKTMPADITEISDSQLIPESLFTNNWHDFIHERANLLTADAFILMN